MSAKEWEIQIRFYGDDEIARQIRDTQYAMGVNTSRNQFKQRWVKLVEILSSTQDKRRTRKMRVLGDNWGVKRGYACLKCGHEEQTKTAMSEHMDECYDSSTQSKIKEEDE